VQLKVSVNIIKFVDELKKYEFLDLLVKDSSVGEFWVSGQPVNKHLC
jgi:hypothetical protein